MLSQIFGGNNKRILKSVIFLLIFALIITCLVPIVSFGSNDVTKSTFQFIGESKSVVKEYTVAQTELKEETVTLAQAVDSSSEVFSVSALKSAYKGDEITGWYVGEDESTLYNDAQLSSVTIKMGETVSITPIYKEETPKKVTPSSDTFKVTFKSGGSVFRTEDVAAGASLGDELVNLVPTEIPDGFIGFDGWYTSEDGGKKVDLSKAVITADTTYFAHFRNDYLVRWIDNSSGNDVVVESSLVEPGGVMPNFGDANDKIEKTVKVDNNTLTFRGWNYINKKDGTTKPYDKSDAFFLNVNSDMDFYTNYDDQKLVIFISQGTPVPSQLIDDGEKIDTDRAVTIREGYSFTNWAIKDGNGYKEFDIVNTPITEDLVLYAQWTPTEVDYSVVYWFENANKFPNKMTDKQKADKSNYSYYKTFSLKAEAGSSIIVENGANKSPMVNGNQLDQLTAIRPNKSANIEMEVRVGDFTGISTNNSDGVILGTGNTVINVYFERTMFDMQFKMDPPSNGMSTLQFLDENRDPIGPLYKQTSSASNDILYSFKAKYEQNIYDLWPAYEIADIKKLNSNGSPAVDQFNTWASDFDISNWVTPRYTLNNELLPHIDAKLPNPDNNQTKLFTARTAKNIQMKTVNYYLENVGGRYKDGSLLCEIGGRSIYVSLPKENSQVYGHPTSGQLGAKEISGFTKTYYGANTAYYKVDGMALKLFTTMGHGADNIINFVYTRNNYSLNFDANFAQPKPVTKQIALGYNQIDNGFERISFEENLDNYVDFEATRAGYTFEGWYYDAEFNFPYKKGDTMPSSNVRLYPKMVAKDHKVKYYASSDTSKDPLKELDVADGSYLTSNDNPKGYAKGEAVDGVGVFKGWTYRDAGSGKLLPFSYEMPINGDLELYATYDVDDFKITYEVGTGSGNPPVDNNKYLFNQKTRLKDQGSMDAPSGDDMVFVGWKKRDANGNLESEIYYADTIYTIQGDTTFVALWGKKSDYEGSLTYYNNTTPEQTVKNIHEIPSDIKLADPGFTKKNHKQIGWADTEQATEAKYSMGDSYSVTGHHKVYAVWEFSGYNVKFTASEGGNLEGNKASITVSGIPENGVWKDNVKVPGNLPGDDYYFTGWKVVEGTVDSSDLTKNGLPKDDFEITEDLVFEAQFAKKLTPVITAGSIEKTYDGEELTYVTAEAANLHKGDKLESFTMSDESKITNFGSVGNIIKTYKIVDADGEDAAYKYKDAILIDGLLTINKKDIIVTASTASFVYDGKAHSANDYTVTGLLPGHQIISGITITGTITEIGSIPNVVNVNQSLLEITGNDENVTENYNIVPKSGLLTITGTVAGELEGPGDKGGVSGDEDGDVLGEEAKTSDIMYMVPLFTILVLIAMMLIFIASRARKE